VLFPTLPASDTQRDDEARYSPPVGLTSYANTVAVVNGMDATNAVAPLLAMTLEAQLPLTQAQPAMEQLPSADSQQPADDPARPRYRHSIADRRGSNSNAPPISVPDRGEPDAPRGTPVMPFSLEQGSDPAEPLRMDSCATDASAALGQSLAEYSEAIELAGVQSAELKQTETFQQAENAEVQSSDNVEFVDDSVCSNDAEAVYVIYL